MTKLKQKKSQTKQPCKPTCFKKQTGSILILVLWIISIALVLVATLASNSRLSAKIIMHQQQALSDWAQTIDAINKAKMELLLKQKQSPFGGMLNRGIQGGEQNKKEPYPFSGQKIKLSFPISEDIIVRIYDISGKLNLSSINQSQFKQIIEDKINAESEIQSETLIDSWLDWKDSDNLKKLNGAEKSFYSKKDPPYIPRNAQLQSVNELSMIKGFYDVFGAYDFTQSFSLYGNKNTKINPNIANKETLLLIPGIDEEVAAKIIKTRVEQPFEKITELKELLPIAETAKIMKWFALSKSRYFSIVIYTKKTESDAKAGKTGTTELYAYKEIVNVLPNGKIKTLRVFPSYKIKIN